MIRCREGARTWNVRRAIKDQERPGVANTGIRATASEQTCYGLKATVVDELVTQQLLRALEPAALELSCQAMETIERDRARLDKHWKQRLEQAGHGAKDAERRYRAVDPENRLVARTLEQRWEEALRAERHVRDDYDRFLREQPPRLGPEERARIAALSSDLPALWHDPVTSHQDRKEIIRHMVEKVVVHRRFPWKETPPSSRGRNLCFSRKFREFRDHFWGEFPFPHPPSALCFLFVHELLPRPIRPPPQPFPRSVP